MNRFDDADCVIAMGSAELAAEQHPLDPARDKTLLTIMQDAVKDPNNPGFTEDYFKLVGANTPSETSWTIADLILSVRAIL